MGDGADFTWLDQHVSVSDSNDAEPQPQPQPQRLMQPPPLPNSFARPSQPQPQRLRQPRLPPNPFAPPSHTDARIRSRSRSREGFDIHGYNLDMKGILQSGHRVVYQCRHVDTSWICERGNILLFVPVVDTWPYNSTVTGGDIVFCQPMDEGQFYICSIDGRTDPPIGGDGSATPAPRVGDESAASAPQAGDDSAASAPRVGDDSTAQVPWRGELLWDIYNAGELAGSCKGKRIYGRLASVEELE